MVSKAIYSVKVISSHLSSQHTFLKLLSVNNFKHNSSWGCIKKCIKSFGNRDERAMFLGVRSHLQILQIGVGIWGIQEGLQYGVGARGG